MRYTWIYLQRMLYPPKRLQWPTFLMGRHVNRWQLELKWNRNWRRALCKNLKKLFTKKTNKIKTLSVRNTHKLCMKCWKQQEWAKSWDIGNFRKKGLKRTKIGEKINKFGRRSQSHSKIRLVKETNKEVKRLKTKRQFLEEILIVM